MLRPAYLPVAGSTESEGGCLPAPAALEMHLSLAEEGWAQPGRFVNYLDILAFQLGCRDMEQFPPSGSKFCSS